MSGQRRLLACWAFLVFGLGVKAFAGGVLPRPRTFEIRPHVVDLNRASVAELQALPGIGPSRAEAIVLHRIRHGPFTAAEQLAAIDGFGPVTVAELEPYVVCGEARR